MDEVVGLSASELAAGVVAGSLLGVWLLGRLSRLRAAPYPPGPPGLPILGNAFQIPRERSWITFADWANDYGNVVHLTALNKHILILSSQEAANELLIKRGANYSNRPVLPMCYMSGWRNAFGLLMYGDRLRASKRITRNVLSQHACRQYIPIQHATALRLVRKLFRNPDQLRNSLHWFSSFITLKIAYDHEISEDGVDKLVRMNEEGNNIFSASSSPGWLVDIFPSLQCLPAWFPGAGFVRQAQIWSEIVFRMHDAPLQIVKDAMADDTSHQQSHSLAATLLRGENGNGVTKEQEDIIRWTLGSMYGAGGETTASTLQTFFLTMALHPDVQRRAQAEIDSVTGGDRLPTYEDRGSLPYVDALLKEVMRWHPAVSTSIPHCSIEEDYYRGWTIPAQTIIIVNIWRIMHDPQVYPDPHTFNPGRYLNGETNPSLNPDPRASIFGHGRRACPGRHLADASVFLVIVTSLASFNISAPENSSGEPVPEPRFIGGVVSHPDDYECVLKPRSEQAVKWLQSC
ncbi:cytochrome P450 [Auriculariales sp. MPI-PUGE-AT-0066]|nr:cytochrome P450 [Auriculariales sp. MPI-PUGE-AT-0066]